MRLLRIRVEGLPLYKKSFDVSFYAQQRVQEGHLSVLHRLFGNIYVNTANAFIGINASGKTTALRVISFASMILCALPLNSEGVPNLLGDETPTVFDIDFYLDNKVCHLQSKIIKSQASNGKKTVKILSERLWMKKASNKINKSNLLDFEIDEPVRTRDNSDEYLSEDVSIMIAINKQIKESDIFLDMTQLNDVNLYTPINESVPTEIISVLDSSIEYIKVENDNGRRVMRLKFYGRDEKVLMSSKELNAYLSSGTIKGVRLFSEASRVLRDGGYLIVDEVENHFNRELVVTLIRLFMDKRTNPNGAVIVFSTHYPELLDELERNDEVFITRSDNGLVVDNLNALLFRNDMNRSEIYQSDYLGGTAPKYKALLGLQKRLRANEKE